MGKLRDFVWWHVDRAWEGVWQAIFLGVGLSVIAWLTNSVFLAKLGASASVAFWGGIPLVLVATVSVILLRRQSAILGSRASGGHPGIPSTPADERAAPSGQSLSAEDKNLPPTFPPEPNFDNIEDFLDYRVQTEFRVSVKDRILRVEHDGVTQIFDFRKIKGTWATSYKVRDVDVPTTGIRLVCGAVVYLVGVSHARLSSAETLVRVYSEAEQTTPPRPR
jgi:hypothetical protein